MLFVLFLWLVGDACARYSVVQLLVVKTGQNVLYLIGLSQRDLYRNGFVNLSFSLMYKKVFVLAQ